VHVLSFLDMFQKVLDFSMNYEKLVKDMDKISSGSHIREILVI